MCVPGEVSTVPVIAAGGQVGELTLLHTAETAELFDGRTPAVRLASGTFVRLDKPGSGDGDNQAR